MKYRKKPVVIEAVQFLEQTIDGPEEFREVVKYKNKMSGGYFYIETLEGEHIVSEGDWIIKGVKGEFYPCKPDIFEMTYEPEGK